MWKGSSQLWSTWIHVVFCFLIIFSSKHGFLLALIHFCVAAFPMFYFLLILDGEGGGGGGGGDVDVVVFSIHHF